MNTQFNQIQNIAIPNHFVVDFSLHSLRMTDDDSDLMEWNESNETMRLKQCDCGR